MAQDRPLATGDVLPESFVDAVQEMLGSYMSPNLRVTLLNPTTVQVVAGPSDDQVCVAIDGLYRWITATVQAAHPGGAAGTHDLFVTSTTDNTYVGPTDTTDRSFAMQIRTSGTPSTLHYRKIGTVIWDGAAITQVRLDSWASVPVGSQFVARAPATAGEATVIPSADVVGLTVGSQVGHASDRLQVKNSSGGNLLSVSAVGNVAIGNALQVDGNISSLAPMRAANGTAGIPAYGFTSDPDTGMYRDVADTLRFTAGGTLRVSVTAAGVTIDSGQILAGAGSAPTPSIAFSGDPNTGFFSAAADQLGVATNGALRMTVTNAAVVGAVPFQAPDAGYSFSAETNMGVYRPGAGILAYQIGGTQVARMEAGGFHLTGDRGVYVLNATGTSVQVLTAKPAASGQDRLRILASGDMQWGNGAVPVSVALAWYDPNTLRIRNIAGGKSRIGIDRPDGTARFLEVDNNDNLLLSTA